MAEKYMFFDSVDGEDERYYTADEFAEYFRQLITSGVFNGGENLKVGTTGFDMDVLINQGYAWLEGYLYKIDTEALSLTLDGADPKLNRIDRIIIRLDKSLEKRHVRAFILKGTPGSNPSPPDITRDENIYEISLAQIKVIAGKSFIGKSEITDERLNTNVCGLVNSLIKADTTEIFDQFQHWYMQKTKEYQNQWGSWWIANPDVYEKQWLDWFDNYQPDASEEFSTWLNGVKAIWINWFGVDANSGTQKIWNDWFIEKKNSYNELAYEDNKILIAMGGF